MSLIIVVVAAISLLLLNVVDVVVIADRCDMEVAIVFVFVVEKVLRVEDKEIKASNLYMLCYK